MAGHIGQIGYKSTSLTNWPVKGFLLSSKRSRLVRKEPVAINMMAGPKDPITIEGIKCYAPDLAFTNSDFPQKSFEGLCRAEAASFWFRSRQRIIEHLVQTYLRKQTEIFLVYPVPFPVRFIGCTY